MSLPQVSSTDYNYDNVCKEDNGCNYFLIFILYMILWMLVIKI